MRNLYATGLLALFFTPVSFAAPIDDQLSKAKQTIESYQNLRDACAEARHKKRQDCLSRLSSASEDYREAKLLVLANTSASNRVASSRR